MKPIFIYGAGGLGCEIKALLRQLPEWTLQGFYDDHRPAGSECEGIKILGGWNELSRINQATQVILAFGDPQIKARLAARLYENKNIQFPILIHPSACLLDPARVQLAEGCVITAGVILTTNIKIGKQTLINLNTTIGHGTVIGEACSVMPGVNLAGEVVLEDNVLIGSGASVLNKIIVGAGATVGAGAVVTKHVRPGATVIGVPAKEYEQV